MSGHILGFPLFGRGFVPLAGACNNAMRRLVRRQARIGRVANGEAGSRRAAKRSVAAGRNPADSSLESRENSFYDKKS
jgi:hypothetical protein